MRLVSFNILLALLVGILFSLPFISIFHAAIVSYWQDSFVSNELIKEYLYNTVFIVSGVGVCTVVIGSLSAWFVAFYEFPFRKLIGVLLLLPMIFPSYVMSYVYSYGLEAAGPIQSFIREFYDIKYGDYYFPNIRSIWGMIFVFSISLYPYVYISMYKKFSSSYDLICISKTLSLGSVSTFFKVILPAARPALFAGLSLVLMESLSDFGAHHFMGIDTITTGIYRYWFLLNDYNGAAYLSVLTCLFAVSFILLEKFFRERKKFSSVDNMLNSKCCISECGIMSKVLIMLFLFSIVVFAFVVPFSSLLFWSCETLLKGKIYAISFISVRNSIILSCIVALFTSFIAFIICYVSYKTRKKFVFILKSFCSIGYGMPGTVIAMGVIIFCGNLSYILDNWISISIIGTIGGIIYSHVFRFMAVAVGNIDADFSKIKREMDWEADILLRGRLSKLRNFYLPILSPGLTVAFLMVFIEVTKELPIILAMRPVGFEVISLKMYDLVADERLKDASVYALLVTSINAISVFILVKTTSVMKKLLNKYD